jgi:ring-1,2-phenylacetyl-CoA epoxidase subunit PaaD
MVNTVHVIHPVSDLWARRLVHRQQSDFQKVWDVLDDVKDPEIPVISIWELGILCDVTRENDEFIISITPTYSGCPAMETIEADTLSALSEAGLGKARVRVQLAPVWTTDLLSPEARQKFKDYGIAPPDQSACGSCNLTPESGITCPRCGSKETQRISEFGSTACKALFQCQQCLEPFDYFKHF